MLNDAMYRVAIVENVPEQADILRAMIERSSLGRELVVTRIPDGPSLEAFLNAGGTIDILMMDIELGSDSENGIDLVKRCVPSGCGTQVIYVTGHLEYCTSVYRTEHVYLLSKPVAQEDLDDALACALRRLKANASKPLSVRFGGKIVLVSPRKINYIESERRKVRIHAGSEEFETYASLSELSKELPSSFYQCHKSFLVNMDYIVELRQDSVLLSSGHNVPVSQKRRKHMREALFAHLGTKL